MSNTLKNLNFLLSAAYNDDYKYKEINEKTLAKLIKEDYSEIYDIYRENEITGDDIFIYRGISSKKPPIFIARPKTRISQNTSNVYTRLMSDVLPCWKGWPKRNKSFICTFDKNKAFNYTWDGHNSGDLYIVLPKNGTEIAVCSKNDIWFSFEAINDYFLNLNIFNHELIFILSVFLDIPKTVIEDKFKTAKNKEIIALFNKFNKELKNKRKKIKNEAIDLTLNHFVGLDYFSSILDYINVLFDPVTNKFEKLDTRLDTRNNLSTRELWFSGEAIFVSLAAYEGKCLF